MSDEEAGEVTVTLVWISDPVTVAMLYWMLIVGPGAAERRSAHDLDQSYTKQHMDHRYTHQMPQSCVSLQMQQGQPSVPCEQEMELLWVSLQVNEYEQLRLYIRPNDSMICAYMTELSTYTWSMVGSKIHETAHGS